MTTSAPRHTIASYVASPSLAPGTRAALEHLGYRMLPAVMRGRWEDASWSSDVRLVDERHLERVPRDTKPVVVLANDPAKRWDNERIVGVVGRPATLATLYPLFQQALEEHPRKAPRAQVKLSARGNVADRRFDAEIVSLSELGCQIVARHAFAAGARINLGFALPCAGMLSLRARVCSLDAQQAAVAFIDASSAARRAIANYVQRRLATA